ncbi:30S ribosomal protein S12 methylthiotransferase RimO [bacterium]|nr:30S ribosomal protein S12 methylthiotransferase RimO [bacterium]
MNPFRAKKTIVCFANLGCHKNQVDAENILGSLDDAGFVITDNPSQADIIIVNTCGFLRAARQESAELLMEMSAYRRKGQLKRLVVAGCMADRDREWLLDVVPEIDQFVSSFQLDSIPELIVAEQSETPALQAGNFQWSESPRWITTPLSYGFLKISDGCDNVCNYCRIPYLRGPFRSKPRKDIIEEAVEILETGRREIVLISQDNTSYGKDDRKNGDFTDLIAEISCLDGLKRLRLMYMYPSRIDRELLKLMADRNNICKYLDIPLQHVNPEVLRDMNRKLPGFKNEPPLDAQTFFNEIRMLVPGITIRTTLMTGFHAETDRAFREMEEFVESGNIDHLGVFSWSPEPDTPAWKFSEDLDIEIAEERAADLLEVQAMIVEERNRELLGRVLEIVIDEVDDEFDEILSIGRMESQAPEIDGHVSIQGKFEPGSYLNVHLDGLDVFDFTGTL